MPMRFEDGQTPAGHLCLRIYATGKISLADSEQLGERLALGSKYHDQRLITFTAKDTEYTVEARKYLPTLKYHYKGLAVVLQSVIVRAAINLMIRFAGDNGKTVMFRDEAEGMRWLDSLE